LKGGRTLQSREIGFTFFGSGLFFADPKELHSACPNVQEYLQMARTLLQVQREIERLRVAEAQLKKKEAAGVIARMKVAIDAYGFTPEDLFGSAHAQSNKSREVLGARKPVAPSKKSKAKINTTAKFADENGNEWVGRGPRPLWLRQKIQNGESLLSFLVKGRKSRSVESTSTEAAAQAHTGAPTKGRAKPAKKGKRKQNVTVNFRDDNGNAWSGRGHMPHWMKAAIGTSGKTKEDFRVKHEVQ
jgi:DNA-binding protein H-NS